MKIGLISYNLKSYNNGQSRFLINIAKGLRILGNEVIIYSLYIDDVIKSTLTSSGIKIYFSNMQLGKTFNVKILTYDEKLSIRLAEVIKNSEPSEVYIVLADEAIKIVNYIKNEKTVYITQGDLSLLFLNSEFKNYNRFGVAYLERKFVSQIKSHAKVAKKFDAVFANSKFTSNIMAFLYGFPINGVVYPPVDQSIFKYENNDETKNKYALAIVRNEIDPIYRITSRLAKNIPLKIIGGGNVKGAKNLGLVQDNELPQLYRQASFVISPNTLEFYGYQIVESMSCSTPTIAYNNGGAPELIYDEINGWLSNTEEEFIRRSIKLFNDDYPVEIRKNCDVYSKKYSILSSSQTLISRINDIS